MVHPQGVERIAAYDLVCVHVKLVGYSRHVSLLNNATSTRYWDTSGRSTEVEETRDHVRKRAGCWLREKKVHAQNGPSRTNIGAG